MTPSPDQQHQLVCLDLVVLLRRSLPSGYTVNSGWQGSPAEGRTFIPDVMVYPDTTDTTTLTRTPTLAVEVLSQNRSDVLRCAT